METQSSFCCSFLCNKAANQTLLALGWAQTWLSKKKKSFFPTDNFLSQQKAALGERKFLEIRIFPEVKLSATHPVNDSKLSA